MKRPFFHPSTLYVYINVMKRIVIMGASSGIGMALAISYLKQGARVGLAARRVEAFEPLQAEYPGQVETACIDVNSADAPSLLNGLIDRLGGMELYFHISGIGYENPSLDPEREAQVITTNAAGFARMIAAAYNYYRKTTSRQPEKDKSKWGRIAAITSVAGTNGIGRMAAYSASKKCAQTYLTALEQLAREEHVNVSFSDIRPGWIATPLLVEGRHYPLMMQLSEAVPLIIKAVEKRRRVAVIGWKWKLLVGLWRLIPNCLWIRIPYNS